MECFKSDSWKLIGQFCRDVVGCKTQVAFVSCDWSLTKLGHSVWFVGYVNVVNKSFVGCW